jgi:hypothetical protein
MDLGFEGVAADWGVFVPAATAGQPSDPEQLGLLWPRRDAVFPAQAQVAAWCAGQSPARG